MRGDTVVGIVVPTVSGRVEHLNTLLDYIAHEVVVVIPNDGQPCSVAWNTGVDDLLYRYHCSSVLLLADDLYPNTAWWYEAAPTEEVVPGAFLYDEAGQRLEVGDGSAGDVVPFSRVPWITARQARHIFPLPKEMHYYNDLLIGDRLAAMGVATRLHGSHSWVHTAAEPGRVDLGDPIHLERYERARKL